MMEDRNRSVMLNPRILNDLSRFAKEMGIKRSVLLNYAMVDVLNKKDHLPANIKKEVEKYENKYRLG